MNKESFGCLNFLLLKVNKLPPDSSQHWIRKFFHSFFSDIVSKQTLKKSWTYSLRPSIHSSHFSIQVTERLCSMGLGHMKN